MILRNFIVFEGTDGTGTTTQLNKLKSRYLSKEKECAPLVHFTCEPTSGEIGRLIRSALKEELHFTPATMARLFSADREEHLYGKNGISSLLCQGYAVYSDRYLFSSLAYQGEECSEGLPFMLNKSFPLPEYLFFFDIDPDIAMTRVEKRAGIREIYETSDFQKRVRARYHAIVANFEQSEPEMTVIRIDATSSVESIAEKIWSIAENLPKIGR